MILGRAHHLILGGLAALALGGCSDNPSRNFGATRNGVNEIRVTGQPPLSVPPLLIHRPPRPGQAPDDSQASDAPLSSGAQVSAGQDALIGAAGPTAPANIRQRVDQDAQIRQQDQGMTDALLFGQPSHQAGAGAIIQGGSKSWMDSIF